MFYWISFPSDEDLILKQLQSVETFFTKTTSESKLTSLAKAKDLEQHLAENIKAEIELKFRNTRTIKGRERLADLARFVRSQVMYISLNFQGTEISFPEGKALATGVMHLQFSHDQDHSQEIRFEAEFEDYDDEWLISSFKTFDPIEQ